VTMWLDCTDSRDSTVEGFCDDSGKSLDLTPQAYCMSKITQTTGNVLST
jgi:hypothetical protein